MSNNAQIIFLLKARRASQKQTILSGLDTLEAGIRTMRKALADEGDGEIFASFLQVGSHLAEAIGKFMAFHEALKTLGDDKP